MPIFIVGFPRSGTTLAQKLVSQQLVIPTLPETHFFEHLVDHEPAGGQLTRAGARALVAQLKPVLEIDEQGLRQLLQRDEVPIRGLFLQIIGQQIGSQALADKGLWIEKTPGHDAHLERIHQMFPKGRFLCIVRNPVRAFASRRELQEPGKGWGEEWKPIELYCAQWAEHVRAMRGFAERHPGQMLILRLEDLAADPEAQLARVREFVGPGFANPIEAPRTPGIIQPFETWKRDALEPADPAIAERSGKGALDAWETWRVKTLLAEEMTLLGYEADAGEPPIALDDLHRKLLSSVDWYRTQFARRDALMDVKTTRIRGLLNELADRTPSPAPAPAPAPAAGKSRPHAEDDDDSFPPPRPITLRGISGMSDRMPEPVAPAPKAAAPAEAPRPAGPAAGKAAKKKRAGGRG